MPHGKVLGACPCLDSLATQNTRVPGHIVNSIRKLLGYEAMQNAQNPKKPEEYTGVLRPGRPRMDVSTSGDVPIQDGAGSIRIPWYKPPHKPTEHSVLTQHSLGYEPSYQPTESSVLTQRVLFAICLSSV